MKDFQPVVRRRNDERPAIVIPGAPPHSTFRIGFCEDKNPTKRRKMEDAHSFFYDFAGRRDEGFFAVFDGHGGKIAANWCGEHFHEILEKNLTASAERLEGSAGRRLWNIPSLLNSTFAQADSYLNAAHGIFSGCTAVVALLQHEERDQEDRRVLYTANVGDSRAVLLRGDRALRLTYDHKGSDPLEQQRVKDTGGFILNERVNGMLAITRSLGDSEMKEYVSGRPYTAEVVLDDADELLILACDGLWDVCTDQEACDLVRKVQDPQVASEILVEHGLRQGSWDNLSVLVVRLKL